MSDRFKDLKKIPSQPAARMLSMTGLKLQTKLDAPASASVPDVLSELEAKKEVFDMLLMLAVALPKRESTWWGCLAARDLLPKGEEKIPAALAATENWVFKPTDENREAVRLAMERAEVGDDTALCATAAYYADGSMGAGDLAEYDAPPAAVAASVLALNMKALGLHKDAIQAYGNYLVDRALDIARGGPGRIDPPGAEPPPTTAEGGA